MKKFGRKRYTVLAKRRDAHGRWTDWTDTNNYQQAVNHACRVEELGYSANIVVNENQIEKLWDILGKNEYEKADAIFDAGFRKQGIVAREIILQIDLMMCCHANGDIDDNTLYRLFDKLKMKYLEGDNG